MREYSIITAEFDRVKVALFGDKNIKLIEKYTHDDSTPMSHYQFVTRRYFDAITKESKACYNIKKHDFNSHVSRKYEIVKITLNTVHTLQSAVNTEAIIHHYITSGEAMEYWFMQAKFLSSCRKTATVLLFNEQKDLYTLNSDYHAGVRAIENEYYSDQMQFKELMNTHAQIHLLIKKAERIGFRSIIRAGKEDRKEVEKKITKKKELNARIYRLNRVNSLPPPFSREYSDIEDIGYLSG